MARGETHVGTFRVFFIAGKFLVNTGEHRLVW